MLVWNLKDPLGAGKEEGCFQTSDSPHTGRLGTEVPSVSAASHTSIPPAQVFLLRL